MATFDYSKSALSVLMQPDPSYVGWGAFVSASATQRTATSFKMELAAGYVGNFKGTGFAYSGNKPIDGNITSITSTYQGSTFKISGIDWDISRFNAVQNSASLTDDRALVKEIFAGADTIKMGSANDVAHGGGGKDTIYGNDGKDTLAGNAGNDTLTGGSGKDHFLFDTKLGSTNRDTITDFKHNTDVIELERDFFGAIGSKLTSSEFYAKAGATNAHDSSDHIIYNKTTGKLYYDKDAAGGASAVHFATLSNKPQSLDHGDFLIV
jgi:Ca2+-binding RTX toxin-like protein